MPHYATTLNLRSPVVRSPRVLQLEAMFDMAPTEATEHNLAVELNLPETWNVGLIVGPSGCGKTRLAQALFNDHIVAGHEWPKDKSLIDGFPSALGIKDVTQLLSSVGFSSPPAWLKPFHVLSNGEQFRVTLARALAESAVAENPRPVVIDEFTSVVDRTVAQIGSAALAKTVRRRGQQFIALACHYDIVPWLAPDWIYQPHLGKLELPRGSLQRPQLQLEVRRVHSDAWNLFKPHHYLTHKHHRGARCFVAFLDERPVAFCSVLHYPHRLRPFWKEHRTVVLPDFQGVGIGNALSDFCAGLFHANGVKPYRDRTSHPSHIYYRCKSPLWAVVSAPTRTKPNTRTKLGRKMAVTASRDRLTIAFEYVGPANYADAKGFSLFKS